MLENGKKYLINVPKAQDDVLKCLVLSTAQRYSVYCQRGGKKPENIHFKLQSFLKKVLKLIN